jgi:aminoglycoside phosphotransferase (APT) family kinase protein
VESTAPAGVDLDAFATWASVALPQFRAPFRADVIAGGRSNITVRLTDADGVDSILRRPPLHGVLPTAHDMGREHRIIHALGPTPVPVPEALALCTDASVIGAPFYVMEYVAGIVLNDMETAVAELDERARAATASSLVDTLVALHAVDVDDVGLGDLARRDELIRRQLKRWLAQYEAGTTRPIAAIPAAHAHLSAHVPEQHESRVVHGDFRLGNMVVDERGTVRAVLDWEICTLGDPLADVGFMAATWDQSADQAQFDDRGPTLAPGFVSRDELLAMYAQRSGRDLSDIGYFIAFSQWRLACILDGVLSRMLQGARGESEAGADEVRRRIDGLAQLAEEYARSL